MIQFLHPIFLFWLFALAIPVILHLFHFKKYKKVYFSNFNFLAALQQQKKNSSKLKNLLLLLLRLAVITLIVFAFATPYIAPENKTLSAPSTLQQVILYCDNSFSMTNSGTKGNLLEEAKKHLFDIAGSYPLGTSFTLLTNNDIGNVNLNHEQIHLSLANIKASPHSKPLSQIFKETKDIAAGNPATLFIASDFQKQICDFQNSVQNSAINIVFLLLNPENTNNLYIDNVFFKQAFHKKNQNDKISISVFNSSAKEASDIPLALSVNDKKKSINKINIQPHTNTIQEISYLNTDEGFYKGVVEISDFPVVFDNKFYFSYAISGKTGVLYINSNKSNPYFNKLFSDTSAFVFQTTTINQTTYQNLSRYNLIILEGGTSISSGLESTLSEYVNNGGNLFILPESTLSIQESNRLLRKLQAPQFADPDTNTVISYIETHASLFRDAFEQQSGRTGLPYAQNFYQLSLSNNSEKLLTDKRNNTLLASKVYGKGNVYVSAFNYNPENSDMVFHPLFVPLMVNMAVNINSMLNTSYVLNSDKPVKISNKRYTENMSLRIRNEDRTFEFIPEVRKDFSGDLILTNSNNIHNPGLYEVVQENTIIDVLAYNYDRAESQMIFCSEDDLHKHFPNARIENIKTANIEHNSQLVKEIVLQDNNLYLSRWFLFAAALLLIIEQIVWRNKLM